MVSAGYSVPMWIANARATGPAPCGPSSSRPSSSMNRAPWYPSSPGWNISRTRPASASRRSTSRRAAPRSMATWVSWPQPCIAPTFSEANSRPVSSLSGRPSMSARSRIVGPGRAPSMTATTESVVSPGRPSSPIALQRVDHHRLGPREPEADLGTPVEPAADLDDVGERGAGGRQERMDRAGFDGHGGSLRATRTSPDCRTPASPSGGGGWHNAPTRRPVRGRCGGRSR